MARRRTPLALLAAGVSLLLAGATWFALAEPTHRGAAIPAIGVGFALICFSQAVRMLTKR